MRSATWWGAAPGPSVRAARIYRSERGEAESKESQVGLCATPFGVDVVGITETVALIGATVSGISARLRKQELEVRCFRMR